MTRERPLIFDVLPDLAATVPWLSLAKTPTPVERCSAIADWLGSETVWMKRDDRISPLYGGNKVRRYEFLLADAKASGKKRIVTIGGIASTQAMATCLFGRELGFHVTLVLFDQPITEFARESIRGFVAAGANVIHGGVYAMTAYRAWRAMDEDSYFIMPGASGPRSNLGYVDAMLELAAQVEHGEMPIPAAIIVPAGSSGTLAALALGAAHLGWKTEIIGVRITTSLACNRVLVNHVIRSTDRFLHEHDARWKPMRDRVRWSIYGDALGAGYGYPTPEAIEGMEQIEKLTGAPGEVTYSGKALAALRVIARRRPGEPILLWNTLSVVRPLTSERPEIPASLRFVFERPCVA